MAISKLYNSTRRLIDIISGRYGNNSLATIAEVNNIVDQWNFNNSITTVFAKYESGVTTMGVPYQIVKATHIINGYIPTSNPALKQNSPCDACTSCQGGTFLNWTGKPCWVTRDLNNQTGYGCVECRNAIDDMSDGTVGGTTPAKIIHLPPVKGSPLADDSSPSKVIVEVLNLPLYTIANVIEDSTNAATGENRWYIVLYNTKTGAEDYSHLSDVVFKITYLNSEQGFVTPQGPQ